MKCQTFLGALLILSSASFAGTIDYNPKTPLYTRDLQAYAVEDLPSVIDKLLKTGKPLILFIHGRGDEPEKSLRLEKSIFGLGSAVPMLEDQYAAAVLMFNWDAKGDSNNDRVRPLLNMCNAADSLHEVMLALQNYYTTHPSTQPFVLIAHSMGTIVVQRYVERYGWSDGRRLFTNVLFTSADADNVDHADWVEKISAVERVFITVNPGDSMLRKSTDHRPPKMLPLGRDPGAALAKGAVYVEIGSTGHHEVFDKSDMQGRVNVCHFFGDMLGGKQPDFGAQFASAVVQGQRYRLLQTKSKTDRCLTLTPT